MDNIYELIQAYGKGKGESKMWESTKVISDYLEPHKEKDRNGYWCMMRRVFGIMSDGHYNEEFAKWDIDQIEYTNRQGEKKRGEYWTAEQVEEVTKGYKFPNGVNKWDKYVAANLAHSDFCKKFDDAQVLDIMYSFFFNDEDWSNGSSTKVWDYICCKHQKK